MISTDFNTLLNFFKVLANENRLKLVGILSQREYSVEELAAQLQLKEPTVSHHLNKLKELDLVSMHPEGNTHLYSLNSDTLSQLNKSVFTTEQMATWTKDITTEAWEEKVLKNYVENDRLIKIPASRKKRLVILQWLVNKFEMDVDYTERKINEIIGRYHSDYATLRREFIGYQMMERDKGIYKRLPANLWKSEAEIMKHRA
ncbi:MAG: metalloregulator ArsR/SmtB family transcription factor [Xenococcaceae cyanobacterium MO_188.B29]|nr:metalloregulator ArsR/SmtB family transcription factor [Xenococcaceae cyanobacterium MO_188.B29]